MEEESPKQVSRDPYDDPQIKQMLVRIWNDYEIDENTELDKEQVRDFVQNHLTDFGITESTIKDTEFEQFFQKYDKDGNEQISQREMASFIKDITR